MQSCKIDRPGNNQTNQPSGQPDGIPEELTKMVNAGRPAILIVDNGLGTQLAIQSLNIFTAIGILETHLQNLIERARK